MVWNDCENICESFHFRDTMNAETYLNMLENEIWRTISTWENIKDLILMQGGAHPHFAIIVGEWLNAYFSGRWKGCRGPCELPASITDLTTFDCFLWD